jgi:hypothetical protein
VALGSGLVVSALLKLAKETTLTLVREEAASTVAPCSASADSLVTYKDGG